MNWLCKLGIHKKKVDVIKVSENTCNIKEYCVRCGKLFENYGMTHIHLGIFIIPKDEVKK